MFRNYVIIAFRNLWKNKVFSAINLLGLSVGMASALLIYLWVSNELSVDRFHEKENRIYLMYNRDADPDGNRWAWANTPKILAPTLKNDYPEVEDVARYKNITFLLSAGEKKMNRRGAFADSGFLNIFSFPLLKGSANDVLKGSYSIVLTEKLAKALFGNVDVVGKIVRIDSVNNCTVTGVLKDLPNNTQFSFDYLLPWEYLRKLGWDDASWVNNSVSTWVLLKPETSEGRFDAKIRDITINHTKGTENASSTELFTQPLSRAYLYGRSENGELVGGQIMVVRLFGIIASFILLIACINFMNLSTAQSQKRAKEVGVRKVAGAQKKYLVLQFLGESILLSLTAFAIAIFLVQLSLGAFNQLVNKQLYVEYSNPVFWIKMLLFVLLTGTIAGSYPAFYLSAFKPAAVLKGTFKKTNALITPRKVLVIVQFTFAIFLMISTIVVAKQIQYGLNRQSGYDRNNLIYLFTQGDVDKHYQAIRSELLGSGVAKYVTHSASPITQRWSDSWGFRWDGSTDADAKIDFLTLGSDVDFANTMGVQLVMGRDIDIYRYQTDSSAVLLNEAAVRAMRIKQPLGMTIREPGDSMSYHVVGVIKDFISESPFQQKISPLIVFGPGRSYFQIMHLRLNPQINPAQAIAEMERTFKKYNPQYPVDYVFADESYSKNFENVKRTGALAAFFAILAIFISCLGLIGLTSYMAENRIKEIGIRKVLGASVGGIAAMLSKDFLKLIVVSFVIAAPAGWWAMHHWLEGYSYRITVQWWVFAAAGLLSILIAVVTMSFQTIKAANANPVKSLKTE